MAEEGEFKIKGATSLQDEDNESKIEAEKSALDTLENDQPASEDSDASEEGEVTASDSDRPNAQERQDVTKEEERSAQLKRYRWCKCLCDPSQFGADQYFLQMDTQVSQWQEPDEPYWLWDAARQDIHESGLHYPSSVPQSSTTTEKDPHYSGYNPKIHGHYDPNADYAQYHEKKREEETGVQQSLPSMILPAPGTEYSTTGTFNRFTGNFQNADMTTERHNDANKSARQMGAYFDVDAAANSHEGRSLKEERRNEKLSKKQIKELSEKRRAKKEKKRLDFYKS